MPTNIRVVHAKDFLKATSQGKLDLEESKKLLIEIGAASASLVDYDILLDTRMAQSTLSENDVWYLAAELRNHFIKTFSKNPKMAVLCPEKRFDRADFFARCAEHNGFQARAFTSSADAYEWLIAHS
ncbi:MAG: hypothetical protein MUF22_02150 [Chitinispirillaceae bacterium]|jgi:hypothetical protein|nr:hypothetical protein [Chitinispirillaceae bacterium]